MSTSQNYLADILKVFRNYKSLGEKAIEQLSDLDINFRPDEESNSIALIVKHLHGNMISRWTDFLTTDGEKENRNRDQEFEGDLKSKTEMMKLWEEGWDCMFRTLESLHDEDLERSVLIRREPHTVMEATNRQLAHYSYHVGQLVFLARMIRKGEWQSLSIPKGKSDEFNKKMFGK
jgi:hypothetical protein